MRDCRDRAVGRHRREIDELAARGGRSSRPARGYHRLIEEFDRLTGVPMVLNTSFNENEPVVMTPEDAIETFKKTRMDLLVLGNHVVRRAS